MLPEQLPFKKVLDFIQEFEVSLAAHFCRSHVCQDVSYGYFAGTRFYDDRTLYSSFRKYKMIAFLTTELEAIQLEHPHKLRIGERRYSALRHQPIDTNSAAIGCRGIQFPF